MARRGGHAAALCALLAASVLAGAARSQDFFVRRPAPGLQQGDKIGCDQFSDSVVLHLRGDGDFGDVTGRHNLSVSYASISDSVLRFGSGSIRVAGTAPSISAGSGEDFNFGADDFTLEAWVLSGLATDRPILAIGDHANGLVFALNDSGANADTDTIAITLGNGSASYSAVSSAGSPADGTWHHLAAVRSGTSLAVHVDGVQAGTATLPGGFSVGGSGSPLYIGKLPGSYEFAGYLDELRVTRGAARYAGNFTAPSTAFPDADCGSPNTTPNPPGATNNAPGISAIADQQIARNGTTGPIAFSVTDIETPAASLSLSGHSSSTSLVPNGNISFGGSGASRTVTVAPAANQSGTATITVTVSDGGALTDRAFQLTVAQGTPPTLSALADITTPPITSTGAIAVTVGDAESGPGPLVLTGVSSNQALLTDGNISFGGSGASRTIELTPESGQTGTAIVTIRVEDPVGDYTEASFSLTIVSAPGLWVRTAAGFSVMKYEAKDDGSNYFTSVAAGLADQDHDIFDGPTTCQALGDGFDLITETQWLALANEIYSQAGNWTGGAVGSGVLYRGNTDGSATSAASSDDNDGYYGTGNSASDSDNAGKEQRRTHVLANGQIIWDVSGNYEEIVYCDRSPCHASGYQAGGTNYSGLTPDGTYPYTTAGIPAALLPDGTSGPGKSAGVGTIQQATHATQAKDIRRGGGRFDGDNAGVFRIQTFFPAGNNGAMRCAGP